MSDVKIYLEEPLPASGTLTVHDEFWIHYLTTVRRLNRDDPLSIAGTNTVADAVLEDTDPLMVKIKSVREIQSLDHRLVLIQALTKKNKFEETIKRGTELGVTEFVPVISDRTVRVPNNLDKQLRRWKKIAMDAARISQLDELPNIKKPVELDKFKPNEATPLYLGDADGDPPSEVFGETSNQAGLIVGPEGGFTKTEKKRLMDDQQSTGVRLGRRNLRSETAAVALSTIWLDRTGNLV